ncbi:MAG TPA: DUF4331 domain-containing protein [Pyrinomonadaceae bacterium]|nr:DUF4331 domain-containing protein [Pyrinomonadaceae bacterium]
MKKTLTNFMAVLAAFSVILGVTGTTAKASSHAEAPMTSMDRYADNTDVYAFRSTEAGRLGFATIIANFIPFQDPSGGPQFYRFDDSVLYEIKIDNTGDGVPDVTYQFQFTTQIVNSSTVLGHNALNEDGVISNLNDIDYNMPQTYSVRRIDRLSGRRGQLLGAGLKMPPSNIGPRVTPNYETNLGIPAVYNLFNGGKVFCGQRDEGFFIDVGAVFDGLAFRSIGASGGVDTLRGFNVNSIAIEVPIQDLTRTRSIPSSSTSPDAIVGIYSTASRRATRVINPTQVNTEGPWRQVSRLGNPLVNEVVIPLGLKDAFNSLEPTGDAVAVPAVLDPELPKLIKYIFGAYGPLGGPPVAINIPPPPRTDLAQIFALGIPVNSVTGPTYTTVIEGTDGPHEYLRLNLGIAPSASPSRLGLLGGDVAGFPNGRRVFDDVVDIALRAVLGGTPFTPTFNVPPNNSVGDGVSTNEQPYLNRFPYLAPPNQGNTPRPGNFPAQLTEEERGVPTVDMDGKLVGRR